MPVNIKNPAIKRIHADVRELMKDPSDQYHASPLESNLFEWHFTIRGPPDTEFEGGVYHGRIILPPEYPFRPPDIIFNTPNGRFSTGMKVCLTISSYHPEHWQPAWGIRLILEALISFFPSPSQGALGGLDWSPEERKRLAAESVGWKCYKCGVVNDLLPELRPKGSGGSAGSCAGTGGGGSSSYADQIKALHKLKVKTAAEVAAESLAAAPGGDGDGDGAAAAAAAGGGGGGRDREEGTEHGSASREGGGIGSVSEISARRSTTTALRVEASAAVSSAVTTTTVGGPSSPRLRSVGGAPAEGGGDSTPSLAADDASSRVSMGRGEGEMGAGMQQQQHEEEEEEEEEEAVAVDSTLDREDDVLSFFALAIALAIVGILVRKALRILDVC